MKQYLIILIVTLFSSLVNAADFKKLIVGNFSSGQLTGWEKKVFNQETDYQLIYLGNRKVLRAESQASASGLVKKVKIDLHQYPYINWSWRIQNRLGKLDEKHKSGDDYAARIFIMVYDGWLGWNTKALNYVWANKSPIGDSWPNAFVGKHAMMLALRSTNDKTSTWYFEKRNIYEDFKKLYGKNIRYINAVAVMTDSDNSHGHVTSFYGDIYFSKK